MATLLYKNYPIIATAEDGKANGWQPIVDISEEGGPSSHVINDSPKSFQTKEEAETFGIEIAKAWVDERLRRLRLAGGRFRKLTSIIFDW